MLLPSRRVGSRRRRLVVDIGLQRIKLLYNKALEELRNGNITYTRDIVELILRISLANRIRIPRYIRRSICKNCYILLVPGVTATIRLRRQGKFAYKVVKCRLCGWIKRYPYKGSSRSKVSKQEDRK